MEPDGLQTFIDDVRRVSSTDDEHEITERIAKPVALSCTQPADGALPRSASAIRTR